jgi:D-amino-acid oxidase
MYDVVIVGAGVIGLSCAIRLQQAGARVAVVSPDPPERTTSWIEAAVWYPTHTDADPRVLAWARSTYQEFARQAALRVPGVTMRATRMLVRGASADPWWAPAVLDFQAVPATGSGPTGSGPTAEWRFTVPAVEMGPYLNWQLQQVTGAGGVLLPRRLDNLAEVADLAPVTVNASGLAARRLADDPAVHPVRGRLVIVANPGLTTSVRDEDNPAGITYVHPRSRDVVLGGTFEPHCTDLSPDPGQSRAILERCTALVPELAGAEVISTPAGLRPAREGGVRLESQARAGQDGRLIHNYGHGGAGMTLGWGCADEVTTLAIRSRSSQAADRR